MNRGKDRYTNLTKNEKEVIKPNENKLNYINEEDKENNINSQKEVIKENKKNLLANKIFIPSEVVKINNNINNNLNIVNQFSLFDSINNSDSKIIIHKKNSTKIIPRKYQQEIFEKIKDKNSIIFMETGKGKTFISLMLMGYLLNIDILNDVKPKPNDKKIVFLVCEVVLVQQQTFVIEQNINLPVFSKKSLAKLSSNPDEFKKYWNNNNIYVSTPKIIYKLLSIGVLKISDIDLLIFDECHHTDQNHPYNLLMNEFYFFYKTQNINIKLPQILGLTASPLKKKISEDYDLFSNAKNAIQKLCENLDSQIVIDPEVANYNIDTDKDGFYKLSQDEATREYYEVKDHKKEKEFDNLLKLFIDELLLPIKDICFEYVEDNAKLFESEYKPYINEKFLSKDLIEYNKILSERLYLYELRKKHILFQIFEKFQRQLFMLLINTNLDAIKLFLNDYYNHFNNIVIDNPNDLNELDIKSINGLKKIIIVIKQLKNKIEIIKNYESDKVRVLLNIIQNTIEEDINNKHKDNHRVIVFVSNRVVAEALSNIVNKILEGKFNNKYNKNFQSVSVVGVNKKKSENTLNTQNSITLLNERIERFKNGEAQILFGTSTVEEGLDVKECDIVIVYSDMRTPKSYIQMKGRARKANAKFLVLTENKRKTISKIEKFINFNICMRNFFKDNIAKDFKSPEFLNNKKIAYQCFFINETHAKLTIKNSIEIYHELVQQFNSKLKSCKIEQKLEYGQERKFHGTGMTTFFYAILKIDSVYLDSDYNQDIKFTKSDLFLDKSSAAAHCYLLFIQKLYYMEYVDNYFNIKIK